MHSASHFFTETEMKSLLQAAKRRATRGTVVDKADYALVVFAYATGCRVSEIASTSLSRSDPNYIDLISGTVVLTQAKYDSVGSIPIDVVSLRTLKWYVRDVRPRLKNAGNLRYLFLSKLGRPYSANVLTQKLSLLLTRFGYGDKTAHSFRHFFCTDLFRRGAHLHEAKALMRHRDVRSTMVYSHATVDDLRAAVNRRIVS